MNSRFWTILGIITVIFVGVLIFKGNKKNDINSSGGNAATNHVIGTTAKGFTLLEYGDYQCPYCGLFHPTVKQVVEKYKDRVAFQFRNYPLQQHQNAFAAARAAEAAGKQGKFWEMHDLLYETQSNWESTSSAQSKFSEFAKTLGLNTERFKTDYVSSAVNNAINADKHEFDKLKLRIATPTFLLNGKQIQPDNSVESFSKILDEAIAKKQ